MFPISRQDEFDNAKRWAEKLYGDISLFDDITILRLWREWCAVNQRNPVSGMELISETQPA